MIPAALDAARLRGDPAADELVEGLGAHVWAVAALLRGVRGNQQPLPAALPPAATRFFAEEGLLPAWLDRARVLRAQRWADAHLLPITTALFCASLPSAYAAARGARVLAATGRLDTDVDRRVNETARFVLDILEPGAFEPHGAGIRAVQKTRLVHAGIRRSLADRGPEVGEVAINQEDLLGTLLTFSVTVLRAVRRLGVTVGAREAEDFFHLWRAVGVMMGIEEALLPGGLAQASAVADQIAERHFQPSVHGRALTAALLARIEDHVPGLRSVPRMLIRYLVGDRVADLLGVPVESGLPAGLAKAARMAGVARAPARALLRRAVPLVARPLLDAIVIAKLSPGAQGASGLRSP